MADVRQILPTAPERDTELGQEESGRKRQHIVSNQNRWSRTVLEFRDLAANSWCELNFQISWHPEEKSRTAHDFAMVGVNFLTEDGSSIDFAHVPGLTRAQLDPHSCNVAGPSYYERGSDDMHTGKVHITFLIPSPAKHATVTFRSWRNSHPFTVIDPKLSQIIHAAGSEVHKNTAPDPSDSTISDPRRSWFRLSTEPVWFRYGVVPIQTLFIRGQLVSEIAKSDGALARVIFRNRHGEIIAPPNDLPVSPVVGAYIDIPVHRQTRRFTIELTPPDQTVAVDLGFQVWRDDSEISLVAPLETSLGDNLQLESILSDEPTDAPAFVKEVYRRLQAESKPAHKFTDTSLIDELIDRPTLLAAPTIHEKLLAVQQSPLAAFVQGQLTLGNFEAWSLPQTPDWTEDPYQSPAWRLEYQSLSWLLDLTKDHNPGAIQKALDLAVSWSLANAWGQPRDPLSAYPASVATRTDVLLRLLAATSSTKKRHLEKTRIIAAEIIRHGFALSEILGQNIFLQSVLQIRIACALFAISNGLPDFPLSTYWRSIALNQLRIGFDQLLGSDGSSSEQSQYYRLELISLGMILRQQLQELPECEEFRHRLGNRLKDNLKIAVAATDPAGMLPPFGDTPHNHHHASWLRRLISEYGRHLLSDPELSRELSYPLGPKALISNPAGLLSFRYYLQKPNWSYFCATIHEQRHENGHSDCTSFVYTARGVRWITDSGGSGPHEAGPARQYLLSSRAHNVAIPDTREQSAGLGWIEASISLDEAHAVRIRTNVHGPTYDHARTVLCLDNLDAVAVFDSFESSQEAVSFEAFLHFEENIAVALATANLAIAFHKKDRLRIIPHPVVGQFTGLGIKNGHVGRAGALQGHLSSRTGGLRPANTLHYGFAGSSKVCGGVILTINEAGLRRILDLVSTQPLQDLLR
ncbi:heparinase II/III family protein [Microvirga sp. BT689]|uniref:heparinase II/III domain-containing protein n=1 Tax=Microvirga arvi TaxID=2778731 RepID=UPI001950585A|nr:heparinase II/III family protein [Microvirga arvi]MBM6580040.1 heparinase II/III family protein [Microvirga arvi]